MSRLWFIKNDERAMICKSGTKPTAEADGCNTHLVCAVGDGAAKIGVVVVRQCVLVAAAERDELALQGLVAQLREGTGAAPSSGSRVGHRTMRVLARQTPQQHASPRAHATQSARC